MTATILEKLSFHVYQMVGIRFAAADLDRSILAIARQFAPGIKAGYTQNYFHEEAIFDAALAFDAQNRYGFVTWLIRQFEAERLNGQSCGLTGDDVLRQVWIDHFSVALERMALCNMTPRPESSAIGVHAWLKLRMADYIPQLNASKNIGLEGLNLGGFGSIFFQRDNPLKVFLATAHKHFCWALGGDDDPFLSMGIEHALAIQWRSTAIDMAEAIRQRF